MKAHIHTQPRALLLWRFGPESTGYDPVMQQAQVYRLTPVFVDAAHLDCRIRDLCAGRATPAPVPAEASQWQIPAMIISGLRHDNGDLNGFLDAVKKAGAEFSIRAAVTPTSETWTLAHLLEELSAEHHALGGGQAQ